MRIGKTLLIIAFLIVATLIRLPGAFATGLEGAPTRATLTSSAASTHLDSHTGAFSRISARRVRRRQDDRMRNHRYYPYTDVAYSSPAVVPLIFMATSRMPADVSQKPPIKPPTSSNS